ncbi:hypothetical protein [Thermobifida fusca]|uniref:hypothetical protein n=3 Tax=Thermobifida fusca TaxID=2021 RepID=UPI0018781AB3|nr:hypothetical protein [Thermobifida fusca]QOS58119.1 hypothetical protein IM867_11970 [Thermobifida fusca]
MMNILGEWQTTQTKSHPHKPNNPAPSEIPQPETPMSRTPDTPTTSNPPPQQKPHADNVAALTLAAADHSDLPLLYSAEAARTDEHLAYGGRFTTPQPRHRSAKSKTAKPFAHPTRNGMLTTCNTHR